MLKLALTLVIKLAILQYASAVCSACNENAVACLNKKEFHPCIDGKANTSMRFSCLRKNDVCTKNARVCMDGTLDGTTPACGDTSNCGKCEGEKDEGKFTCTSRTTFTMCFGGALSDIRDTCPTNQMCDVGLAKQGQYPCVPNCRESQIEFCDLYDAIDVPVTTKPTELPTTSEKTPVNPIITTPDTSNIFTPTPPPLTTTTTTVANVTTVFPPTTQNPAQLFCSQQSAVGRYPSPNDITCKNYIYCFRRGGAMQTTFLKCQGALYFNPSTRMCDSVRPNGCI